MIRLVSLMLLALPCFAQWSSPSIEFLMDQAKIHSSLKDSDVTTLWGGIVRTLRLTWQRGDDFTINSKMFGQGKITSYLSINDKKSPLVVFFPGIFGSHKTELSPLMIQELEKLDAHVLVPPNFLNSHYLAANPLYENFTPSSDFDIKVVEEIIKSAIERIQLEKVSAIHLIGESLGTSVASAFYATNQQHIPLLQQGSLTLLCPPLNLRNSMLNFDRLISQYGAKEKQCSKFYNYPMMLYHFFYQDTPQDMGEEFISCMKGYLYGDVFLKTANKSLKAYYQTTEPEKFKEASNFTEFFKNYKESLYQLVTQDHQHVTLSSWLSKAITQNRGNIRILSTQDDFVNLPGSWEQFIPSTGLAPDQVLLLPWGGHCAFLGLDGWDQIFMRELGLKKRGT